MEFFVKGDAPSTPNLREHWATKADRARKTRARVARNALPFRSEVPIVIHIALMRVGAGLLDSDNLQGALKSHRDGVASFLRIDDATRLVEWSYSQAFDSDKSSHGVKITIQFGRMNEVEENKEAGD